MASALSFAGDGTLHLVEAYLICLADRFETAANISTLDKDFQIYRWRRNKPFRILLNPK